MRDAQGLVRFEHVDAHLEWNGFAAPELASVFPDTESVNRALKFLVATAEAAASPLRRRRKAPNKRLKRTA